MLSASSRFPGKLRSRSEVAASSWSSLISAFRAIPPNALTRLPAANDRVRLPRRVALTRRVSAVRARQHPPSKQMGLRGAQRSPRLSSRDRMQRLHLRFRLLSHEPQIVLSLQIYPDLRLSAEHPREPHRHIPRDRCPAVDYRRYALTVSPERTS